MGTPNCKAVGSRDVDFGNGVSTWNQSICTVRLMIM